MKIALHFVNILRIQYVKQVRLLGICPSHTPSLMCCVKNLPPQ